ncbi:Clp protease N-terminal domain-containing protein [Streptomyces sp. NPDC091385]|uniref:Clp protease N-terminal domain-containing protein n=1 Tax=Streptomyces sp. NPDC091385 TaxID=3365997 RepID=UPI003815ED42
MEPRTVGRSAPDEGVPRAENDAGTGTGFASVIAGARRRAVRDGDRQIDSAHLLHSLLESDPEARAAVGTPTQLARLLGYLVQRSIGYGLRWQGGAEVVGAEVAAGGERWSPVAAAALRDAEARGTLRRGAHGGADGVDLLAALVTDPRSRAVEVLERAGIPAGELRDRLRARTADDAPPC